MAVWDSHSACSKWAFLPIPSIWLESGSILLGIRSLLIAFSFTSKAVAKFDACYQIIHGDCWSYWVQPILIEPHHHAWDIKRRWKGGGSTSKTKLSFPNNFNVSRKSTGLKIQEKQELKSSKCPSIFTWFKIGEDVAATECCNERHRTHLYLFNTCTLLCIIVTINSPNGNTFCISIKSWNDRKKAYIIFSVHKSIGWKGLKIPLTSSP